jgi:glutamyl-Q tRNA(Asp) synthetase
MRLRVETPPISFQDAVQGLVTQNLEREVGDFILRRADGLHAYQLAVVVDDAWQGISHVVRGADLSRSTPRQILLQHYLGLPTPVYAHLPLVLDRAGPQAQQVRCRRPRRFEASRPHLTPGLGLSRPSSLWRNRP